MVPCSISKLKLKDAYLSQQTKYMSEYPKMNLKQCLLKCFRNNFRKTQMKKIWKTKKWRVVLSFLENGSSLMHGDEAYLPLALFFKSSLRIIFNFVNWFRLFDRFWNGQLVKVYQSNVSTWLMANSNRHTFVACLFHSVTLVLSAQGEAWLGDFHH